MRAKEIVIENNNSLELRATEVVPSLCVYNADTQHGPNWFFLVLTVSF